MNTEDQIRKFGEFFEKFHYATLLEVVRKGNEFLVVDFSELSRFDPELAEELLEQPEEVLAAAELAIKEFDLPKKLSHFHVRMRNLPDSKKILIRALRSKHLKKMMWTDGLVRQKSDVRPQVTSARFECPSCGNVITLLQKDKKLREPSRCGCGRKGKFKELSRELIDAQGIVLEEASEDLEGGEQPKRMNIFLKNDLVSPINDKMSSPGSKIRITGWISEVPVILREGGQSTKFEILLEANHVESVEEDYTNVDISKEEELEIKELAADPKVYERLAKSVAPSIYGHEKVKEALLLQFVGGVKKERPDGTVTRGDMHVLLVGDPGSGKSQMLKRAIKIAPKARYVSGKGVSGAGLTAAVVKDEFLGGWSLEAGALVLSNGGFVMIDEMDKMGKEDRAAMHEALEQQSFHYDTKITLTDGSETKIGEFVERLMKDHMAQVVRGTDCFILSTKRLDYELFSTDWNEIIKTKIDRVSKHIAPHFFVKIRASHGREIIVTPEHPVFCLDKGKIITKEAGKLKGDEWLPIPLEIPIDGEEQKFSIAENEIFNVRAVQHIHVPAHNSPEFFKIVGYLLAEGSKESNRGKLIGVNFTNKDPRLLDDFTECMDHVFGLKPYKQVRKDDHDERWMLRYTSRELAEFMLRVCPTVILRLAGTKEIPEVCMKGTKADVASMLSCMFEGDGHVAKKLRTIRIGYASNSRRMCEQVQDLLLRFKIRSNLTEHKGSYKVSITGHANISKFNQHIKFVTAEKNATVGEYIVTKKPIRFVKDSIPNIANIVLPFVKKYYKKKYSGRYGYNDMKYNYLVRGHHIHRMFLQRILNAVEKDILSEDGQIFNHLQRLAFGSIGWEQIKNVERIENKDQQWVYDVTIEPHHTFVSENLVLHNTVSISKANIQATLHAETTVLAAANPKLGRFDQMSPIAPQIDLPPTLINRFDLIFPIKDIPEKKNDELMAAYILELHQNPGAGKPEIPTQLLRKFILYARQRIKPKITDQALDELKTYYVQMRSRGQSDDVGVRAIPITARQLEALVRLAEAYAKVRLSDKVNRQDARRAIDILEYCLNQVARDEKTGQIDIDSISTGITSGQRNKIIVVKEAIIELEGQIGKTIAIEDIVQEATAKGIKKEEVEEAIEKLRRQGDIFEPKPGFIQRIV